MPSVYLGKYKENTCDIETESTFRDSSLLLAVLSDSENAVLGIASSYLLISVLILNTLV